MNNNIKAGLKMSLLRAAMYVVMIFALMGFFAFIRIHSGRDLTATIVAVVVFLVTGFIDGYHTEKKKTDGNQ